ncbi:MAG: peptidase S11 [Betaproteobacteria bacterium HGW-Betaproteobacteria-7]|jgi:D-alanyl-D-alanine carboxypeptidase/D-alanyl-D-alanine endopeptidase (penicillin-binding protein 7)|nr:MAG: peptidase S11 [Betaproteobacteria bacterium HGW-Betaproteobacteria-7]
MFRCLFVLLVLGYASCATAVPFASRYALVIEESSGKVLLSKNADIEVPIASLTKLMTAMVVLDANPDLDELITVVDPAELTGASSRTRLTDGGMLPRRTVLELALISSDNHAAAALAYAYPGGVDAFVAAVAAKVDELGMTRTRIEEPTGLSWNNRSTAEDLAKMAAAAAEYPEIERITTTSETTVDVEGRTLEYRNTNRLVGLDGWDILLSKTGFTTPAGRCLIMRLKAGGQTVIVVLLNATSLPRRTLDALNVRSFLTGEPIVRTQAKQPARSARGRHKLPGNTRMAVMRTAAPSQVISR